MDSGWDATGRLASVDAAALAICRKWQWKSLPLFFKGSQMF